jgi:hypothetical protein
MRVSRVLDVSSHPTIHLGRLELGEQLIHRDGLILLRLKNGIDLLNTHRTIQRV